MNLSINANYFWQRRNGGPTRTADERRKLCVDAGFKVLDYSVHVWGDNWEAETDDIPELDDEDESFDEQNTTNGYQGYI